MAAYCKLLLQIDDTNCSILPGPSMIKRISTVVSIVSLLLLFGCEPVPAKANPGLCTENIARANEYMAKKNYEMADVTLQSAEQVFGCDSASFTIAKTDVLLAKLGKPRDRDLGDSLVSAWTVSSDTSNMTDEKSVFIAARSEPYPGNYGTTQATMNVRCMEDITSVIWDWDEYLGDDDSSAYTTKKRMTLRLDSDAPEERWYIVSTDGTAVGLWNGGDAIPFIQRLTTAKRLVARITPYGESPREAVFDVARLDEHLPELQEACHWN